jgi:hypothetical protein
MESEALRKLRTMRDVRTIRDIARGEKIRTTNSLSKTREEVGHLEFQTDRRLPQVLREERKRFAAREAAAERSRQRIRRFREKLAAIINRNRSLMRLRDELQRAHFDPANPEPPGVERSTSWPDLRKMELRY